MTTPDGWRRSAEASRAPAPPVGPTTEDPAQAAVPTAGAPTAAGLLAALPQGALTQPGAFPLPAALAHAAAGSRYWLPRQNEAPRTPPSAPPASPPGGFDVEAVRRDFPQLHRDVHGHPLIWLDNGATTLKPRQVVEAVAEHYARETSNVHRGAHTLAEQATQVYEEGRQAAAELLGTPDPDEIVFVRGTTEAVNLVAQSWGRANLGVGDEIVVSAAEHHSNLVPWQLIAEERRARVRPIPLLADGQLDQDAYRDLLGSRTKLVAITHASNVLGTVPPVAEMTALAHRYGAKVLIDGAQAVSHFPVDVTALDADFYAFSGHKIFAPTGIGVLFGKRELLEAMPPWQGGGNMIDSVSFQETTYAPIPHRLEAGTGHIAGVAGLRAALDYLAGLDRKSATAYEEQLTHYATGALATVPGLRLIGQAPGKIGVLTFLLEGTDPTALAAALDQQGIALRAGHHCAQPALASFGLSSAVRASLALYNTVQDVDALVAALHSIKAPPSPSSKS
ncbi:cysteine desulfurase [Streptomyces lunaelactis]|uniref:cysteine desulfurase n=1 Tax=Streptomyces lunaelactis TaxID=1535768 RepID=A0A2R4T0S8_9ACTN|nr:SufS family cysteine desulfurase [Streptomyces lunaelactis]AVZ72677.1 cysteine desulfurase [Streptomyces lunaelactis]NUK85912.1 SufS family cysteine desulfurase [Streptomyces lunaelactis]